jgi:hypothetical protein
MVSHSPLARGVHKVAAGLFQKPTVRSAGYAFGQLVLCLSLLLNLSIVTVENLKWSGTDQSLDNHHAQPVSVLAKGGESQDSLYQSKKQNSPTWLDQAFTAAAPTLLLPCLKVRHLRFPPTHYNHSLLAPSPPRSPTA